MTLITCINKRKVILNIINKCKDPLHDCLLNKTKSIGMMIILSCIACIDGFVCYSSGACLPIEQRCDDKQDCWNNEDQWRCGRYLSNFTTNFD